MIGSLNKPATLSLTNRTVILVWRVQDSELARYALRCASYPEAGRLEGSRQFLSREREPTSAGKNFDVRTAI